MFIRKPQHEVTPLEEMIAEAIDELRSHTPFSEEYATTMTMIERLEALRPTKKGFWSSVSPDTIVVVGGNIVLGIAVLNFEKAGIVTTKLFSFMSKASR